VASEHGCGGELGLTFFFFCQYSSKSRRDRLSLRVRVRRDPRARQEACVRARSLPGGALARVVGLDRRRVLTARRAVRLPPGHPGEDAVARQTSLVGRSDSGSVCHDDMV